MNKLLVEEGFVLKLKGKEKLNIFLRVNLAAVLLKWTITNNM